MPPVTLPSMYSLGGCALSPFQIRNLCAAASSANFMSYAMIRKKSSAFIARALYTTYSHICYLGVRGRRH